MMTQKETCWQIRSLGLTVSINMYREYVVNYRADDPRHSANSAYYTQDADDAYLTAVAMSSWKYQH